MNKKIALYIRLSKEDGIDGGLDSQSVVNQRNMLVEYISGHEELSNYEYDIYIDDGFSGTNFDRPAFNNLLKEVYAKKVDTVVVKDFSRLGRDELEVINYVDIVFPSESVRFVSINDNYDSKLSYGQAIPLGMSFQNLINSFYAKDISTKVRTSHRVLAKQGKYICGSVPFGYKRSDTEKNKLVVDEEAAYVIREIFRLATEGYSTGEIANKLNSRGILTMSQYKEMKTGNFKPFLIGARWTRGNILRVIKNEAYIGSLVYGKSKHDEMRKGKRIKNYDENDVIVVKENHEPIVSKEVFEAAQQARVKVQQKSYTERTIHLFSKKLKCSCCNKSLARRTTQNIGVKYCCYSRAVDDNLDCSSESIDEKELANVVLQSLKILILGFLDETTLHGKQNDSELTELKNRFRNLESIIGRYEVQKREIYDKKCDGKLTISEYIQERAGIDNAIDNFHNECCLVQGKIKLLQERPVLDEQVGIKELSKFLDFNRLDRKMVEMFVNCIYLEADGSVLIEWNFNNVYDVDKYKQIAESKTNSEN